MKFKKRLIPFYLLPFWLLFVHSGCLSFRMSESKQREYMQAHGQQAPDFQVYQTENRQIHYTRIKSEAQRPVVIFVHGSPGSSSAWIDYLADTSLSKDAELISVDRPGYGDSGYGHAETALWKESLMMRPMLEQYGKDRKIILVGHSLGGPLICRMAMDYPDLIDGLVVVAGSIDPALEPHEWYRPVLNWIPIRWMIPASFKVSNQEIMPVRADLDAMLPFWRNITCPVTVIHGDADSMVPVENAYFAQRMLVHADTVKLNIIPGMNHFVVWTKPQVINDAIRGLF